jgi:hypothetical protein
MRRPSVDWSNIDSVGQTCVAPQLTGQTLTRLVEHAPPLNNNNNNFLIGQSQSLFKRFYKIVIAR